MIDNMVVFYPQAVTLYRLQDPDKVYYLNNRGTYHGY